MSTLTRWLKFNAVGAAGMGLQLGALAMLNRTWPGHYLVATAAALELTLLHNFAWHLNYTWRDRSGTGRDRSGRDGGGRSELAGRLVRFHLSNGMVSMVGNLGLMPFLVEGAHIPVVAANAIAILCCSIMNFCLGNDWVFAARAEVRQG